MADSYSFPSAGPSQQLNIQQDLNMDAFAALNGIDLNDFSGTDSSAFSTPFDVPDANQFFLPPSVPLPQPQIHTHHPIQPQNGTASGPRYHPDVGWYYPAQPPSHTNFLPTPPPSQIPMMPALNEGFAPTCVSMMQNPSPAQVSGYACNPYDPFGPPLRQPLSPPPRMSQVDETDMAPRLKCKRKWFDPAGFLGVYQNAETVRPQKRTRKSIDASTQQIGSSPAILAARTRSGFRPNLDGQNKRKIPSLEAPCICQLPGTQDGTDAARVKRPRNAFILFRQFQTKSIMRDFAHEGVRSRRNGHPINQKVSQVAAAMWRAASPETKARYQAMAEEEKARHAREHPGYKYKPRGKVEKDVGKFGAPGCICGAYEKNLAKWKREGGELIAMSDGEAVASPDGLEQYVSPRSETKNPQHQALAVPTTSHMSAMTDLRIPLAQQQHVAAAWQQLTGKTHHPATNADSSPVSVRRSQRNASRTSVSCVETGMEDEFETHLRQQLREALVAPSLQEDGKQNMRKPRHSLAMHTLFTSPPAKNTRSRSRTSIEVALVPENEEPFSTNTAINGKKNSLESLFHDFDNMTTPMEELDFSEFETPEEEEYDDDDDNNVIAVAPAGRESRQKASLAVMTAAAISQRRISSSMKAEKSSSRQSPTHSPPKGQVS